MMNYSGEVLRPKTRAQSQKYYLEGNFYTTLVLSKLIGCFKMFNQPDCFKPTY